MLHISTSTIDHWLSSYGYIIVLLGVGIESTGIPFPGETILVSAAIYAGAGHLQIPFVIAAAALGAIVGDNIGYEVGRSLGRGVILRYGKYVHLEEDKLKVAEDFFARHGDKTVFLGRFIAVLRAWAAFLAGVNRMRWIKFFAFNAAGGITWATLYGILAFELGKNLPVLHRVEGGLTIVGVLLALGFVGYIGYRIWKHRREAAARADDESVRPNSTPRDRAASS